MADVAAPEVRKAGTWVIVWGVLLIVTGFIAIMQPAVAALAFELLLGWLLVFAGVVEIVYAVQQRGHEGFRFKMLTAILTLVLGIFLLLRPGLGIASIALLIGAVMLAHGVSSAPENVFGIVSLIFWALIIVISLKYVAYVLKADNQGEGGILALTALATTKPLRPKAHALALAFGLFGASLLFGDGIKPYAFA